MDDRELLKLLKDNEADASSYYTSELAADQASAMERYLARPYGDEAEGRSKVVTHDIEDAINWIMPDLMRVFMASDELVTIEPASQEDEQPYPGDKSGRPVVKCVGDYLDHIFWQDNAGEQILHDMAFDGLLQRMGVVRVVWEDPEPQPPMDMEGVTPEQLSKFTADPEYAILGQEPMDDGRFKLQVQRTPKMGKVRIRNVPPEGFRISRQATSLAEADYHGEKKTEFLANIIRRYPDRKYELENPQSGLGRGEDDNSDARLTARWSDESSSVSSTHNAGSRRKVDLLIEYIRADYDGDGIVELRYVERVGDVILANEITDKTDYVMWSPVRIAHRSHGRSLADLLMDIQRVGTVLTRRMLDGLSQSLTPKLYLNMDRVDPEAVDDVLDNQIGGVIRGKGAPGDTLHHIVTPDVSASALQALEWLNQKAEEASGVTRHSQGLDPSALNKTATGIDLLQAAAKTRIEMVARWLGVAVQDVFVRILEHICAHQDQPRMMKLKGQWIDIDPRRWSHDMAVKIHVGMSAASRQTQVANLMMISQKQEQILTTAGPGNPLVTIAHYRNTLTRLVEAMGYRDPTRFFAELPPGAEQPQPQPPQQDPKMVEVQGKMQLEGAKAQHAAQLSEAELQHRTKLAELDAQTARELALLKAQSEQQIAQMRIASETQIARERMAAEMALAEQKAEWEHDLAERKLEMTAKAKTVNGSGDGFDGSVSMGGAIG